MTKPNIAILGATGVVGREITKITEELNVEISCPDSMANIYFTTDGSEPQPHKSLLYTSAIKITKNTMHPKSKLYIINKKTRTKSRRTKRKSRRRKKRRRKRRRTAFASITRYACVLLNWSVMWFASKTTKINGLRS